MSISKIFVIIGFACLLSLLTDKKWRDWGLLGGSILFVFWLQPVMPIRYMDYWLPLLTFSFSIFSYLATKKKVQEYWMDDLITIGVIGLLGIIVGLSRYITIPFFEGHPPQIREILIGYIILSLGIFLIYQAKVRKETKLTGIMILFSIILLVILKQPALNMELSRFLRQINGQSTQLDPSLTYIQWLGISYVAFRLIHTLRERQTGKLPEVNLQEYLIYVFFFPAFTAGPIDRIERFIKDLRKDHTRSAEQFIEGGKRITTGLFKKFVLADTLALFSINQQNTMQVNSTFWLWIMVYAYAIQIYMDFSGYTDIAVGVGKLMGFDLPENFKRPYLQKNITQFWNNWHITLTQWFRAYFFYPLTRKLRRSKINLPAFSVIFITQISTMVLIAMWHGMTLNYLIWGLWQGIGLFIHNQWAATVKNVPINLEEKPIFGKVQTIFGTLLTFHYIALGWIWFALPDFDLSARVLGKLFGM